jgi:hypothetical protein
LLKCDKDTFKQILRVISSVETSNISDNVNVNNNIADKLVEFLYGELADINTRNNNTFEVLNKLLCVNYALCNTLQAKHKGVSIPYSFEDIASFVREHLPDEISIVGPLNSLLQRTDDLASWSNYLGFNYANESLYEDHDMAIDSIFNILFRYIKKLFPSYPNVYAKAISSTLIKPQLNSKLNSYEYALAKMLKTTSYNYMVGTVESRAKLIDYMFYYLGFDVLQYNTKGKIEFKFSSGVINGDIAEYLTKLEANNKQAKLSIYNLIKELNTFVFIDNGSGTSFFDKFIDDLVGTPVDVIKIIDSKDNSIMNVLTKNAGSVFKLATLENAIGVKKLIESNTYSGTQADKKLSLDDEKAIKNKLNNVLDLCNLNLSENTFFTKFGEYLLIR